MRLLRKSQILPEKMPRTKKTATKQEKKTKDRTAPPEDNSEPLPAGATAEASPATGKLRPPSS